MSCVVAQPTTVKAVTQAESQECQCASSFADVTVEACQKTLDCFANNEKQCAKFETFRKNLTETKCEKKHFCWHDFEKRFNIKDITKRGIEEVKKDVETKIDQVKCVAEMKTQSLSCTNENDYAVIKKCHKTIFEDDECAEQYLEKCKETRRLQGLDENKAQYTNYFAGIVIVFSLMI